MALIERDPSPEVVRGAERALEVRLGQLGGFELRPTRLFVWSGEERRENERIVSLADQPVGLGYPRQESRVRAGPVEVRTLGNPLLTIALAGVHAARRLGEAARPRD